MAELSTLKAPSFNHLATSNSKDEIAVKKKVAK